MPSNPSYRKAVDYSPIYEELFSNLNNRFGIGYDDLAKAETIKDANDMMEWVQCSILPEDNRYRPLRYHDACNSLESAAICIVTPYPVNWQQQPINSDGINQQLGPSDMFIATFDDSPWCILVLYNPNPSYRLWRYQWTWNGEKRIYFDGAGRIRANKAISATTVDPTVWDPHGTYLYCQADSYDLRYFWVDAVPGAVRADNSSYNSRITVNFPGITVSSGTTYYFNVNLYRYFNGQPQLCQTQSVISGMPIVGGVGQLVFLLNNGGDPDPAAGTFPTASDYYTLTATALTTVSANQAAALAVLRTGVEVSHEGVTSVLEHHSVEEAESLSVTFSKKGRINAQGLRMTDVAMLQYINGQIAGLTAFDGDSWYTLFQYGLQGTRVCFDKCSKQPGAIVGELDEVRHRAQDALWRLVRVRRKSAYRN